MTDQFTIEDAPSGESDSQQWVEEVGDSPDCLNCGTPRVGEYCSKCGQRHLTKRLTFALIAKRIFTELTSIDRGFLYTSKQLLVNPGQLTKDYVSGRQKPYVNPLTYFIVGATIQLLALWIAEPFLRGFLDSQLGGVLGNMPDEQLKKATELYGGDPAKVLVDTYIFAIQNTYTYGAFFFFAIPFAILLAWTHRLTGERFQLGETLVYSLYIFGQMLILTAVVNVVLVPLAPFVQPIFALLVYVVYPQYAHRPFFKASFGSRAMTFFSTMGASFCFGVSLMVIAITSIVIRILWVKNFGA